MNDLIVLVIFLLIPIVWFWKVRCHIKAISQSKGIDYEGFSIKALLEVSITEAFLIVFPYPIYHISSASDNDVKRKMLLIFVVLVFLIVSLLAMILSMK